MIHVDGILLENKPLSNFELIDTCKKLGVPIRGVFMRDELPRKVRKRECGVVNLDNASSNGTHWVCYYKDGKVKCYFDSFGLVPPLELQKYLGEGVEYSTDKIQEINQVICGHLCVYVLNRLHKKLPLKEYTSLQSVINEFI